MSEQWHCRQIPSGDNPIVVCERETLLAENEMLRTLVAKAFKPALEGPSYEGGPQLVNGRYDLYFHTYADLSPAEYALVVEAVGGDAA